MTIGDLKQVVARERRMREVLAGIRTVRKKGKEEEEKTEDEENEGSISRN